MIFTNIIELINTKSRIFLLLLLLYPIAARCDQNSAKNLDTSGDHKKPIIVASIPPLLSLSKFLLGENMVGDAIINGTVDPHQFELKPTDLYNLNRADLILFVGADFEYWSKGILKSLKTPILYLDKTVGLENKIRGNSHFWLNPLLLIKYTHKLAEQLIKISPDQSKIIKANEAKLIVALKELDASIKVKVDSWHYRSYFCSHPAFTYFTKRYGLKELGCINIGHSHEITPSRLSKLYKLAKNKDNRIMFILKNEPLTAVNTFIDDNNLLTVVLDDLGGEHGGKDQSYFEMMNSNVEAMEKIMSREAGSELNK